MLQVRPELTWRDVQGIMAQTSQIVENDPRMNEDENFWTINGAGFHHSYLYGFGVIDATAAVRLAESFELFPEERVLWVKSLDDINVTIPDDSSKSAEFILTMPPETSGYFVESVVVKVFLDHPSRGDLELTLKSPQGTASVLHSGQHPENTHLNAGESWDFLTVRNWGEKPNGNWILNVSDKRAENVNEDCVDLPYAFFLPAQKGAPFGATVSCAGIERAASKQCVNGVQNDPNLETLVDSQG